MTPPKYKHIIWDWNGTLVDDAWLCVDIINGQLSKRGLPTITLKRYQDVFDFPVKEYYRRLGFDFNKESFEISGTEFIEVYRKRWRKAKLQDSAIETLTEIQELGIPQTLLSASEQRLLVEMIQFYNLGNYFVRLLGLDDHYAGGKIDIGKKWVAGLNTHPREVLLIGDTVHDHEVAAAIGADCILFSSGHHSYYKLTSCDVPVFETLTEVLDFVKNGVQESG